MHARVKEIFAYKKHTQPMGAKSAGCAFRNPISGPGENVQRISAGQLIDQAGLKGYTVGGARVSERHANFIEAKPDAKASDVISVMKHVQRVVREKTGCQLDREIVVWRRSR